MSPCRELAYKMPCKKSLKLFIPSKEKKGIRNTIMPINTARMDSRTLFLCMTSNPNSAGYIFTAAAICFFIRIIKDTETESKGKTQEDNISAF